MGESRLSPRKTRQKIPSRPSSFYGVPPDVKLISELRHHLAAPPGSAAELDTAPGEAHSFFAHKEQPEHSAISPKPSTDSPFIRFDLLAVGGIRNPDPGCCGCGAAGRDSSLRAASCSPGRGRLHVLPGHSRRSRVVREFLRPFRIRSRSLPPEPGRSLHSATWRRELRASATPRRAASVRRARGLVNHCAAGAWLQNSQRQAICSSGPAGARSGLGDPLIGTNRPWPRAGANPLTRDLAPLVEIPQNAGRAPIEARSRRSLRRFNAASSPCPGDSE